MLARAQGHLDGQQRHWASGVTTQGSLSWTRLALPSDPASSSSSPTLGQNPGSLAPVGYFLTE